MMESFGLSPLMIPHNMGKPREFDFNKNSADDSVITNLRGSMNSLVLHDSVNFVPIQQSVQNQSMQSQSIQSQPMLYYSNPGSFSSQSYAGGQNVVYNSQPIHTSQPSFANGRDRGYGQSSLRGQSQPAALHAGQPVQSNSMFPSGSAAELLTSINQSISQISREAAKSGVVAPVSMVDSPRHPNSGMAIEGIPNLSNNLTSLNSPRPRLPSTNVSNIPYNDSLAYNSSVLQSLNKEVAQSIAAKTFPNGMHRSISQPEYLNILSGKRRALDVNGLEEYIEVKRKTRIRKVWYRWRAAYRSKRYTDARAQLGNKFFLIRLMKKAFVAWHHKSMVVPQLQLMLLEVQHIDRSVRTAGIFFTEWSKACIVRRHLLSRRTNGCGLFRVFQAWIRFWKYIKNVKIAEKVLKQRQKSQIYRNWWYGYCLRKIQKSVVIGARNLCFDYWKLETHYYSIVIDKFRRRWTSKIIWSEFFHVVQTLSKNKKLFADRFCSKKKNLKFLNVWRTNIQFQRDMIEKNKVAIKHKRYQLLHEHLKPWKSEWKRMRRVYELCSTFVGRLNHTYMGWVWGAWKEFLKIEQKERAMEEIMSKFFREYSISRWFVFWAEYMRAEKKIRQGHLVAEQFALGLIVRCRFDDWKNIAKESKRHRRNEDAISKQLRRNIPSNIYVKCFRKWQEHSMRERRIRKHFTFLGMNTRSVLLHSSFNTWRKKTRDSIEERHHSKLAYKLRTKITCRKGVQAWKEYTHVTMRKMKNIRDAMQDRFSGAVMETFFITWKRNWNHIRRAEVVFSLAEGQIRKKYVKKAFTYWRTNVYEAALKYRRLAANFLQDKHLGTYVLYDSFRTWKNNHRERMRSYHHEYVADKHFMASAGFYPWLRTHQHNKLLMKKFSNFIDNTGKVAKLRAFEEWHQYTVEAEAERQRERLQKLFNAETGLKKAFKSLFQNMQDEKRDRFCNNAVIHSLLDKKGQLVFIQWGKIAKRLKRIKNKQKELQLSLKEMRRLYAFKRMRVYLKYLETKREKEGNADIWWEQNMFRTWRTNTKLMRVCKTIMLKDDSIKVQTALQGWKWYIGYRREKKKWYHESRAEIICKQQSTAIKRWREQGKQSALLKRTKEILVGKSSRDCMKRAFQIWTSEAKENLMLYAKENSLLKQLAFSSLRGQFTLWRQNALEAKRAKILEATIVLKHGTMTVVSAFRGWQTHYRLYQQKNHLLGKKVKIFEEFKRHLRFHLWVIGWKSKRNARNLKENFLQSYFDVFKSFSFRRINARIAHERFILRRKHSLLKPWHMCTVDNIRDRELECKKDDWKEHKVFQNFVIGVNKEKLEKKRNKLLLWHFVCRKRVISKALKDCCFASWREYTDVLRPARTRSKRAYSCYYRNLYQKYLWKWREHVFRGESELILCAARVFRPWLNYCRWKRVERSAKLRSHYLRITGRVFDAWHSVYDQTLENIRVLQLQRKIRVREREKKPSFYYSTVEKVLDKWRKCFVAKRKFKISVGCWALQTWSQNSLKDRKRVAVLNRRRAVRDFNTFYKVTDDVKQAYRLGELTAVNLSDINGNISEEILSNINALNFMKKPSPNDNLESFVSSNANVRGQYQHVTELNQQVEMAQNQVRNLSEDSKSSRILKRNHTPATSSFFLVPTKSLHSLGGAFSNCAWNQQSADRKCPEFLTPRAGMTMSTRKTAKNNVSGTSLSGNGKHRGVHFTPRQNGAPVLKKAREEQVVQMGEMMNYQNQPGFVRTRHRQDGEGFLSTGAPISEYCEKVNFASPLSMPRDPPKESSPPELMKIMSPSKKMSKFTNPVAYFRYGSRNQPSAFHSGSWSPRRELDHACSLVRNRSQRSRSRDHSDALKDEYLDTRHVYDLNFSNYKGFKAHNELAYGKEGDRITIISRGVSKNSKTSSRNHSKDSSYPSQRSPSRRSLSPQLSPARSVRSFNEADQDAMRNFGTDWFVDYYGGLPGKEPKTKLNPAHLNYLKQTVSASRGNSPQHSSPRCGSPRQILQEFHKAGKSGGQQGAQYFQGGSFGSRGATKGASQDNNHQLSNVHSEMIGSKVYCSSNGSRSLSPSKYDYQFRSAINHRLEERAERRANSSEKNPYSAKQQSSMKGSFGPPPQRYTPRGGSSAASASRGGNSARSSAGSARNNLSRQAKNSSQGASFGVTSSESGVASANSSVHTSARAFAEVGGSAHTNQNRNVIAGVQSSASSSRKGSYSKFDRTDNRAQERAQERQNLQSLDSMKSCIREELSADIVNSASRDAEGMTVTPGESLRNRDGSKIETIYEGSGNIEVDSTNPAQEYKRNPAGRASAAQILLNDENGGRASGVYASDEAYGGTENMSLEERKSNHPRQNVEANAVQAETGEGPGVQKATSKTQKAQQPLHYAEHADTPTQVLEDLTVKNDTKTTEELDRPMTTQELVGTDMLEDKSGKDTSVNTGATRNSGRLKALPRESATEAYPTIRYPDQRVSGVEHEENSASFLAQPISNKPVMYQLPPTNRVLVAASLPRKGPNRVMKSGKSPIGLSGPIVG